MWVDQRQIVSRQFFHNPCTEYDDLEFVFLGRETLFCARPREGRYPYEADLALDNSEVACINMVQTFRVALRGSTDEIEYPPDGSRRQEGHVVTLHNENAELCAYLHQEFSAGRGYYNVLDRYCKDSGTERLSWSPGPMSQPGPLEVDINNDGAQDLVALAVFGPGSIGQDIVLMRDGKDRDSLPDPSVPLDLKEIHSRPPLIPITDTAFAGENRGVQAKADRTRGLPRVLETAFEWNGDVFVLASAVYSNSSPKWAVYRIAPDYGVSEVCVLDRVAIHF